MKKIILANIVALTLLSTAAFADGYTMTPDGNYVAGGSYSMAPDGSYVGGSSYTMTPDGEYIGQ